MNHLPRRLRESMPKILNAIKREMEEGIPGLSNLIPTSRTVRLKRRRRWWGRDERRHLKVYNMVTGRIGGRSRARILHWDPAQAGSDRSGMVLIVPASQYDTTMEALRRHCRNIEEDTRRHLNRALFGMPYPEAMTVDQYCRAVFGANVAVVKGADLVTVPNEAVLLDGGILTVNPVFEQLDNLNPEAEAIEGAMQRMMKELHANTIMPATLLPRGTEPPQNNPRGWQPPGGYPRGGRRP